MNPQTIALAGLLHDIGKLMLRGSVQSQQPWNEADEQEFGHVHALWTAVFIDTYVPAQWRSQVYGLASRHHRPVTREERIVQLADRLSAAGQDDEHQDDDVRQNPPQQLRSIFCGLKADNMQVPQHQYLPLHPLQLTESTIFPAPALAQSMVSQHYQALWQGFHLDVEQLRNVHGPDGDLTTYLESLLLLLQRYTWSVPAAARGQADVTLYDHGRMTGALAAVLDRPEINECWLDQVNEHLADSAVALLVGGDISGVQEFIYTISARGATSSLRGRSFYLQLLTEATARYVLRRLNLPVTNLIYSGGGNFYLLVRPTDFPVLHAIQQEISCMLMQQHRGALSMAVAETLLTAADFFGGKIRNAWGRLHGQLGLAKQRRFADLQTEDLYQIFAAQGEGGGREQLCQVCGDEHDQTELLPSDNAEEVRVCPSCRKFEKLGKDLRSARVLLLVEERFQLPGRLDLVASAGHWQETLRFLGMSVQIAEECPVRLPAGRAVLFALDDDMLGKLRPGKRTAIGRKLLVNTTPILCGDDLKFVEGEELQERRSTHSLGDVKPFTLLAVQSCGIRRLGVLRMDVDNLGKLFQEGLGEGATLAQVAGLSFAISLYFEGWVGVLAEAVNRQHRHPDFPTSDRLYAIYSGGDDLFFVGSWDVVVELALAVRRDLSRYAAGHPGIHTSGGIVLTGGKYPLAQAADDAGEAEHKAKAYRRHNGHDKDAICFLDIAQPWEKFGIEECCNGGFGSTHQLAHLLADMTDPRNKTHKAVPQSLIRNLLEQYEQYAAVVLERRRAGTDLNRAGAPQTPFGPWMWRTVYLLTRMANSMKTEPESQKQILELRTDLWQNDFGNIEWIGLAARWADLLRRNHTTRRIQ